MQDPKTETKERWRSERWITSIPCKVLWGQRIIRGEVANISFQGALIAAPSATPPVNSAVTLVFYYESELWLTARVDSVVVHTSEDSSDTGGLGGFGLEFQESLEEITTKLSSLIEELRGGDSR